MAAEYYEESNINEASMCKWSYNSGSVMNLIKEEDRCGDDTLKVLGLVWNREMDTISTCKIMGDSNTVTKRKILQVISSVFDPLELFAPVLLLPKLLIQDVRKLKLDWDITVPDNISKKWKT